MKKNFLWNTIGVFTTSLTSLIYLMILTNFTNLETAGIFAFAFSLACLAITIASFGGRTYQVTDVKNELTPFTYIFSRYSTVIFSGIAVLIFSVVKDYNNLTIIVILSCFKFMEEISDVYFGIIQKAGKLYIVGISMFLKSLINVLLFFAIIYFTSSLLYAVLILLLNNFLFTYLVDRRYARKSNTWNWKVDKRQVITYFKKNLPICLYAFLTMYITSASKYAIEDHLTSSVQAIFNILMMPATVMVLISGFIMNPLLVSLANLFNSNKYLELNKMIFKILLFILGIGLLGIIGAYLLGIPLLNFIYGINLNEYLVDLILIIIGSILFAITVVFANIFIIVRKTVSQVVVSFILSIIALLISETLVLNYGIHGGVYSYLLTMMLRFIFYCILFIYIYKKIKKEKITL